MENCFRESAFNGRLGKLEVIFPAVNGRPGANQLTDLA